MDIAACFQLCLRNHFLARPRRECHGHTPPPKPLRNIIRFTVFRKDEKQTVRLISEVLNVYFIPDTDRHNSVHV